MNTATSADHDKAFEIIRDIQIVDLTYRDAQFVRAELADAIARAVQAEREACDAKDAELIAAASEAVKWFDKNTSGKMGPMSIRLRDAIRARGSK